MEEKGAEAVKKEALPAEKPPEKGRGKMREKMKAKRASVRGKLRGCLLPLGLAMLGLMGCTTADPTQKAQTSESKGNTVNVCLSFGSGTNAVSVGDVAITMSDVIGTQVQSADTAGNESVEQRPSATMTPGVTGDKPIETIGTVASAALTGGASGGLAGIYQAAQNLLSDRSVTNAAVKAAAEKVVEACADGSCGEK